MVVLEKTPDELLHALIAARDEYINTVIRLMEAARAGKEISPDAMHEINHVLCELGIEMTIPERRWCVGPELINFCDEVLVALHAL